MENKVGTDKFCTDSELGKGGSRYPYCTDVETQACVQCIISDVRQFSNILKGSTEN